MRPQRLGLQGFRVFGFYHRVPFKGSFKGIYNQDLYGV